MLGGRLLVTEFGVCLHGPVLPPFHLPGRVLPDTPLCVADCLMDPGLGQQLGLMGGLRPHVLVLGLMDFPVAVGPEGGPCRRGRPLCRAGRLAGLLRRQMFLCPFQPDSRMFRPALGPFLFLLLPGLLFRGDIAFLPAALRSGIRRFLPAVSLPGVCLFLPADSLPGSCRFLLVGFFSGSCFFLPVGSFPGSCLFLPIGPLPGICPFLLVAVRFGVCPFLLCGLRLFRGTLPVEPGRELLPFPVLLEFPGALGLRANLARSAFPGLPGHFFLGKMEPPPLYALSRLPLWLSGDKSTSFLCI